jgi:hypothetical protein
LLFFTQGSDRPPGYTPCAMAPLSRRQAPPAGDPDLDGAPPRRSHAGLLRRERRALLEAREELLRKLGGLMVEMYRRNEYRDDLLAEICADALGIDSRVAEIDERLSDRRQLPQCSCGVPILRGSRYCPSCGRDLSAGAPSPPVEAP